ncbi:unnamed protein product [Effrenium voratum]|nr:unnamed protein product [Effrenium voratum]
MAMALISLFACLVSVAALPIEETDTNLIYCNFPVEPEVLANYLNGDKLMPDLYEGKAWVSLMVFNLESLKLQSPLGKIPMGGGGEMVKLSTYVRTKDSASKAGYLMLDLDFPQGARGWMQRAGCSFTQKGLHCGEVEVQVSANLTSVFASSSDGASLSAEFEVLEEEDAKFLEYIIYRPYKVLQEGKQGTVRMAKQEGKEILPTQAYALWPRLRRGSRHCGRAPPQGLEFAEQLLP